MSKELTSPDKILAVPLSEACRIFAGDQAHIRRTWRKLAASWHPDHHPGNPTVTKAFIHLAALRDAALENCKAQTLVELAFKGNDGQILRLHSGAKRSFEIGAVHICREGMAFTVECLYRSLFENARRLIAGLRFDNDTMASQLKPSLPELLGVLETEGQLVMLLKHEPGQVILADLVVHIGGKLDPRHVAWIVSGLCNIACYLSSRGVVHGAIDATTVLIDPASHRVALIGGWFYACVEGAPFQALPVRTIDLLPALMIEKGRANLAIDLLLIRRLAAELLGDPACTKLLRDASFPPPFAAWLSSAPAINAFADYANWERVRDLSFGPRRFVTLPVKSTDIYPALVLRPGSTEE